MRVGEDRFDGPARVRRAAVFFLVGGEPLEGVPAEVGALRRGHGRVVDLLEAVLADVADREPRLPRPSPCRRRSGRGCAGHSCRSRRGRVGDERVVGRDRVGPAVRGRGSIRSSLPSRLWRFWALFGRIAARAAVARAEVEEVAEELQLAAVVIGVDRVGYLDYRAAGAPRGSRRAPAFELVDPDVPLAVGVVDVEATAAPVVGREGDREQAALAAGGDQAVDVEEGPAESLCPPRSTCTVPPCSTTNRRFGNPGAPVDVDGAFEAADLLQADLPRGPRCRSRSAPPVAEPIRRPAGRQREGSAATLRGGAASHAAQASGLPASLPVDFGTTSPLSFTSVSGGTVGDFARRRSRPLRCPIAGRGSRAFAVPLRPAPTS